MALTKVRKPVAEIELIASGTSKAEFSSVAGPLDINISGSNVMDIAETSITIDDLVSLVVQNITSEKITLATTSGSDGVVDTDATRMRVGTTDTTDLELMVNSIPSLTLDSTGKVTLLTTGTLASELVDKNYVDSQSAGAPTTTSATNGQLIIPTAGDDIIIKWGVLTGTGSRVYTFATDTAAFPTSVYSIVATPQDTGSANSDGWTGVQSVSAAGFTWNAANRGSYAGNVFWIAIGT